MDIDYCDDSGLIYATKYTQDSTVTGNKFVLSYLQTAYAIGLANIKPR